MKRTLDSEAKATREVATAEARTEQVGAQVASLVESVTGKQSRADAARDLDAAEALEEASREATRRLDVADDEATAAEAALEAIQVRETTARQAFGTTRDLLAALKPPLATDSLAGDWTTLVQWCHDRSAEVVANSPRARTDREREMTERTTVVVSIRQSASEFIDDLGDGADRRDGGVSFADAIRDSLADVEARARSEAGELERNRDRAAKTRAKISQLEADAQVATLLGHLLHADGFQRWLMEEALADLVVRATVRLQTLTNGQYSLSADDGAFKIIDHRNADEIPRRPVVVVNLRGIIDLLSKHLYSGPEVFVRELLQNGVDAIAPGPARPRTPGRHPARGAHAQGQAAHPGLHRQRRRPDRERGPHVPRHHRPDLEERRTDPRQPSDFIGQFGIGILSCFVVSDEIVVIIRSAKAADGKTVEWRARPDGTYTLKTLDRDFEPGTQVWLTAKQGLRGALHPTASASWPTLRRPAPLPHPRPAGKATVINARRCPGGGTRERQDARGLLDFGREAFGVDFFDAIPLRRASVPSTVSPSCCRSRRALGAAYAPRLPQEHAPVRRRRESASRLGVLRPGRASTPTICGRPRRASRSTRTPSSARSATPSATPSATTSSAWLREGPRSSSS